MLPRLVSCLRKTEIVAAGKVLVRSINPSRREQLLRSNYPERFAQLVADQILAAIAAGERQVRGLDPASACKPRDQLRVFVIRVRRDPEHAHPFRRVLNTYTCRGWKNPLRDFHSRQQKCRSDRSACYRSVHCCTDGNAQVLTATPRRFAPAGCCTGAFTSATMRSCSFLCASAYPSAGLARSGRPA